MSPENFALNTPCGPEWAESSACPTLFPQWPVSPSQRVLGEWPQAKSTMLHPCFAGLFNYFQMFNFLELLKTKLDLEIISLPMAGSVCLLKNTSIKSVQTTLCVIHLALRMRLHEFLREPHDHFPFVGRDVLPAS